MVFLLFPRLDLAPFWIFEGTVCIVLAAECINRRKLSIH